MVMIQNRGVPRFLRGKENVGILSKLVIRIGTEFETSKAILYNEGDKVSFRGTDMWFPPNDTGLVINRKTIMLKLGRRMDGGATTKKGIGMEDGNDGAMLGIHVCAYSTNGNIRNLVVVNALDIHTTMGLVDKPNIRTSNPSITTTINKRQRGSSSG
jgi:hypothetical protein